MSGKQILVDEVINLFRKNPSLKDEVIVIGGVAVLLRLMKAEDLEYHRTTIDLDLVLRPEVNESYIRAITESIKKDLLPIDGSSGKAGPLNKEIVDVILADYDNLNFDDVPIPVVGPMGLLVSKLARSGVGALVSRRGIDLLDVIRVWLAEPEITEQRFHDLKYLPTVANAVSEFKSLFEHEYSPGSIAVLEELNLEPGDPEFIYLKAQLDRLFFSLNA